MPRQFLLSVIYSERFRIKRGQAFAGKCFWLW